VSLLQTPRAPASVIRLDSPLPVWRRPIVTCAVLAAVFFAAVAPTLLWSEFTGGMENFNLETALEMTRDGHWLIPTLDGDVRTRKPPLAEWITALGIRSSQSLAWGARWPSLLCAALTLAAIYELGRLAGGPPLGFASMCVGGSTYLFLKFAREASYDTQLTLWVTLANVCLAWAILRGRWWLGCGGAGAALGLALMTKGPPAILETVIPPVVLVAFETALVAAGKRSDRRRGCNPILAQVPRQVSAGAVILGVLLALAIALPWTLYVMVKQPGRMAEWYNEVSLGTEARFEQRIGVYFTYFAFLLWVVPWTIWFLAGLRRVLVGDERQPTEDPKSRIALRLMAAWVLLPLLVMWFFPERRERYVLPLIGPTAVLCGWGLLRYLSSGLARQPGGPSGPRWPLAVHWATVAAIGLGLPILGAADLNRFRTAEGRPWFSPALAAGIATLVMLVLMASVRWKRPGIAGIAGGTFAIMLIAQASFTYGYSRAPGGISESKRLVDSVLRRYPDAVVYNANNRPRRRDLPLEMTIYLNRVVPRAEHPETLQPDDRPQIIIFPEGARTAPIGFKLLTRQYIKEEWWDAYVLPAVQ